MPVNEYVYPMNGTEPVVISRCDDYDVDKLEKIISDQLEAIDAAGIFKGKKVVIKPNLVMKKEPEGAATTHPAVLEAVLRLLKDASEVIIAESPPGVYSEQTLRSFYKGCGIAEVAERCGAKLNYDTSFREVSIPGAKTAKIINFITPILEADVIINLAKLKTHALTKYSGAVKNFFGTVPGIQKFETHARFPDYGDFGSALVDICQFHTGSKPTVNLLDGILAMEGNGPTGGSPRKLGFLIAGMNPFAVDMVGTKLIGADNVIMLEEGIKRGFAVRTEDMNIVSVLPIDRQVCDDFVLPDTSNRRDAPISLIDLSSKLFGGRFYRWLQPKPVVNNSICVGCGECVRSCPRKTIEFRAAGNKKRAFIVDSKCIKCYCCQELCPFKAVSIKKNPLLKILGG